MSIVYGGRFMNIKCLFGFHTWDGCICSRCGAKRDEAHSWDGCKCSKCGQKRNKAHSWDGCKCSRCGQLRNEAHRLKECKCEICGMVLHKWHGGFTCSECGITREEKGQCKSNTSGKTVHKWEGGCTCIVCGVVRERKGHHWEDDICITCGKKRVFKSNFAAVAERACHSQQTVLIYRKDVVKLRNAVIETLMETYDLEYDEARDRAKQVVQLECSNCGKLSVGEENNVDFFAKGGILEQAAGVHLEPRKKAAWRYLEPRISSIIHRCPNCQETKLKVTINVLSN